MNPLFVAIDTPELERALAIAQAVKDDVGGFKLGLEFFAANGPEGVREVAALGLPIFLDLKLHDIPNTVARAVATLAPALMTVHAAGGKAMLKAAKAAAPAGTRIVAVTVLTSLDGDDLSAAGVSGSPADQVARLARLAKSAGLDGIVCSGAEVASVREHWPDGFFVVPGVRPEGGDSGDQKRVVTPAKALGDGASILVIGRPITAADNPASAASAIANSLKRHVL